MKIGIITASYNRTQLLERCIESVFAQKYQDWTMYVVDDCSDVDIDTLREKYSDTRLNLTKFEKNSGSNAVRNFALEQSIRDRCDFIFLLDDDDFLAENSLSSMINIATLQPKENWFVFNVAGFNFDFNDNTYIKKIHKFDYIGDYLMGKKIRGDKSHLIKTSAIGNIRFSTQVRQGDEWTFFLALANQHCCLACPEVVKIVDYQVNGLSVQLSKKNYKFNKIWLDTQKPFLCWRYRPFLRRAATRSLQSILRFPIRLLRLWLQQLKQLSLFSSQP